MPKVSPHSLKLEASRTFERTFEQFKEHKFKCSCGLEFSLADAFKVSAICPNDLDEKKPDDHVVSKQDVLLSVPMKFKVLGNLDVMACQSLMDDLASKYLYGIGEPGKPGYKQPEQIAPVGGKSIPVSRAAIQIAAILHMAQLAPTVDEYTVEEIMAFMLSDSIALQMSQVSFEVQEGTDDSRPLVDSILNA